jgi:hypothetical protein
MADVVDLDGARLRTAARKAFRNWRSRFGEEFDLSTGPQDLSDSTLLFLAQGKEDASFYLHDLITNLLRLGSGLEVRELRPSGKLAVMDRYLFVLDLLRFEVMRRLGWLDKYPGEERSLVELVTEFEDIGPAVQAGIPVLSRSHPDYPKFASASAFEKESVIRRLIPQALEAFDLQ